MNDQSTHIARILERTAVSAFKLPLGEIIPAFDEAEAECLLLAPSEELRLEVRRRVAQWKMSLFCERNGSFKIVEKLYNDAVALGYTNFEIDGTIQIQFAQYCVRQARTDVARRVLQNFITRLEAARENKNLEDDIYFLGVYKHLKAATEKILDKVNKSEKKL